MKQNYEDNLDDAKAANGHALFLYSATAERFKLVAEYFKQGLARNELCIFVTPESADEVAASFNNVRFDASKAIGDGALRIFEMEPTYMPDGHFVADYMLTNVKNFMQDAKEQGFSGLRTAGEMSWLKDHPDAAQEGLDYENSVNHLTAPEGSTFTGLCLYPMQSNTLEDNFSESVLQATRAHPVIIDKGRARRNPEYSTAH